MIRRTSGTTRIAGTVATTSATGAYGEIPPFVGAVPFTREPIAGRTVLRAALDIGGTRRAPDTPEPGHPSYGRPGSGAEVFRCRSAVFSAP